MKRARTTCPNPACGKPTSLTNSGKLWTHNLPPSYPGERWAPLCPMTGQLPTGPHAQVYQAGAGQ
jgi:hypothetical protein